MRKLLNRPARNSGFALVIALSLMAFILLLLLSITTLVRVETSASGSTLSRMKAQQNALLGVHVALGELQRTTGPDQRVTARADQLDTNPDSLSIEGVSNPYWLAVYKTIQPGSEIQALEGLRTWATDRSAAGRIDWLVSARSDLRQAGVNPVTTDVVALNGGDSSNVISLARYEDNTDTLVDVKVGKIDVLGRNDSVAGRYAWWVADENAKFRINVTKEDAVLNGQPFESRWSLMAPHQSNPSIIPELSTFDPTSSILKDRLERTGSVDSFVFIDPDADLSSNWKLWSGKNSDDFTLLAQSLPVDVTEGRLKEDLTVYLETNLSGLNDSDPIVRGGPTDVDYRGRLGNGLLDVNYDQFALPKFGMLKSWYQTGMTIDGFAAGVASAPRSHTSEQHGLSPVILRTAVYFGLTYQIVGTDVYPVFLVYPKFTLWNPHNVPIAPAKYVVQVRARTALNTQYGAAWAAYNDDGGFSYKGYNSVGGLRPEGTMHFNWANPGNPKGLVYEDDDGDGNDDHPYLTFVIDNDGFAPGETLLYSAQLTDPSNPTQNEYVNSDGMDYLTNNHSTSDWEGHNLLVNEDTGNIGFFYIVSNSFMRPDPATFPVDPIPGRTPGVTNLSDELRATFFVSDTKAGTSLFEPSMSTKLWVVSDTGDAELLEFIDLEGRDSDSGTPLDWDAGNSSANFTFEEFGETMSFNGTPNFEWGFGYFARPMGNTNTNLFRNFNRFNYLSQRKHVDDPSNTTPNFGRLYEASADSTPNWFDGAYPSAIPGGEYQTGINFDGYDTLGAYGLYHHHTVFSHQTVYPLYDYVRSETGLLSLGYLSNISFAVNHYEPSFPFGNSESHTHIDRIRAYQTRTGFSRPQYYSDLSYLLNESLWDRFFVSTIPQNTGIALTTESVLPNTRHHLVDNFDGSAFDDAQIRARPSAFKEAAANVRVEGGFNVNSTSLAAWKMLLASLLGEKVTAANGLDSNVATRIPLSKRSFPLLGEVLDPTIDSIRPDSPNAWSSTRSLSAVELERLAEGIVEEVKRRGPFLSIADFVNRRLVPNSPSDEGDYLGIKGTLQAAIDKISTDSVNPLINDAFYTDGDYGGGRIRMTTGDTVSNVLQAEHERGMPGNQAGSRMFGAPAFLTQADVLSALAPLLSVRGDTFLIRAYGESNSAPSGQNDAKVWCEALVQREAAPVDVLDSGGVLQPNGAFGRRFNIISIRWVNESDIL